MIKSLIQTGNSKALIISKDMREHLGVTNTVEVEFRKNTIVLRNPEHEEEEAPPAKGKKGKKGK